MRIEYFLIILTVTFSCNKKQEQHTYAPKGMVWIAGESFSMGINSTGAFPNETPKHKVQVSGFYMDQYEVTNKEFKKFIDATGYITTAEHKPKWELLKTQYPPNTSPIPDSLLKAGSIVYFKNNNAQNLHDYTQWWQYINGANWKHPLGPESSIDTLMNHPVIHVSWFDAMAYAKWAGKDLPTEAEWELSAGAAKAYIYPWGNRTPNDKVPQSNYFQGEFPRSNSLTDNYLRTAPVGTFPKNCNNLYDMGGNVWEWCKDKYHIAYFKQCKNQGTTINPKGPETSFDPNEPYVKKRVVKGGSFLCNDSYCSGYKISRKMQSDPYTSFDHTGFRCVIRETEKHTK